MMSSLLFFLLFFFSLKDFYFFSSFFKISFFEMFVISIPIFSAVLIYYLMFNNMNLFDFKNKVIIILVLISFSMCVSSDSVYVFIFFLELCTFSMTFLILDMSKDFDKFSSVYFMVIFNMIGSIPFFFFFFLNEEKFLNFSSNLSFLSSYSFFYFFAFCLVLLSKLPIFYLHFWLTKAHVSASGVCSMILAGLMLKLGSFGLFKFSFSMNCFFSLFSEFFFSVMILGILIFSLLMIRFFDLKYFVACSSVVHMGLIFPFLLSGNFVGLDSSILMMVGHGLVSFILFFLVSMLYEFSHNRSFDFMKSLESFSKFFIFSFFFFFFLNMGIPPFINFMSEIFSFFCLLKFSSFLVFFFFSSAIMSCLYLMFCLTKESFGKTEKLIPLMNFPSFFIIFFFYVNCYWFLIYMF